ncbi:MAG: hypothetical protein IJ147_06905 [Lachnospiraceae bacterium]|nr:hypothetical protein [Lachnospiraceae bacterium]
MEKKQCFMILGIEQTTDQNRIKKAYRDKLAVTNPEDDPEGFKRLREAYESACAYAQEPEGEDGQGVLTDDTPSGLWAARAAEIYSSLKARTDVACWEKLFEDELFQSLEEEENCRNKLLRFIMEHFRLPSEVWRLFDKKMGLTNAAAELRELFPADFINFVLSRCERGEEIVFAQFEGADDADYDLFMNYYDDCWQAIQDGNLGEAEKLLEEAGNLMIYHPCMEICRAQMYMKQGKEQEATELMESLLARYPEDEMIGYHTAEIYWKQEMSDKAAKVYQGLKSRNEKHYMANVRLTQWYYDTGAYQEAKKCAEAVLSAGADDAFMETLAKVNAKLEQGLWDRWKKEKDWEAALELCWCYLQDGATSKGLRLARDIKTCITEEKQAEYTGLLAKLLVEQADYEDAIAMSTVWEKKLQEKMQKDETDEERKKDQDRVRQSYMIRMQSYRFLGYKDNKMFAKAIEQIEAVESGSAKDVGLMIDKAQILMEMEEYERSLEISLGLIQDFQVYAAAASALEVYRRELDAGGVVQNARLCIQKFPSYIRAYEHLAKVYLDLKQYDQLEQVLAEAEQNKIESVFLEAYRYQMTHTVPEADEVNKKLDVFQKEYQDRVKRGEMAFYEKGLPLITEYLYWYPGVYMLGRRAAFYKDAMQYEKALADYDRALGEEPGEAYLHSNMSYIYRRQGDHERALYHIKLAILYAEDGEWKNILHCSMAKIYMLLGDNEQAYANFAYYESQSDQDTSHYHDMAECLARLHRPEEAAKKLAAYYRKSNTEFYDGYRKSLTEMWNTAGDYDRVRQVLDAWKREQKIPNPGAGRIKEVLGIRNHVTNDTIDYYCMEGWEALRTGDGKTAITMLTEQVRLVEQQNRESKNGLEDLIFAAILHGAVETGQKYARKLQAWMQKDEKKAVSYYHDMPKGKIMQKFLAFYFEKSDEWLQELLDQEKGCAVCDFCLLQRCKELEAAKILLLRRQGKLVEAKARLASDLEVQPYDEYMQAIAAVLK